MLDWASRRLLSNMPDANGSASASSASLAEKPKVGIALALGGGAARLGSYRRAARLDEAEIEVSMIAGTSIGALVGGCYLAGKLDELEEFARSLTRRRILSWLDLKFGGSGLFGGMKLDARMREHMSSIVIEDLPRPLVCVATEIRTGHEIWLTSGSLIMAMRASYALPGVFEPVTCNGRLLVDGALVNPVPVSVLRAYEQPAVVAVNLHYELFGRSAVIKHNARRHRHDQTPTRAADGGCRHDAAAASRRDRRHGRGVQHYPGPHRSSPLGGRSARLSLMLKLRHIGLSEFHRAGEAIEVGYQFTKTRVKELRRLREAAGSNIRDGLQETLRRDVARQGLKQSRFAYPTP
jgi:NTE family protein